MSGNAVSLLRHSMEFFGNRLTWQHNQRACSPLCSQRRYINHFLVICTSLPILSLRLLEAISTERVTSWCFPATLNYCDGLQCFSSNFPTTLNHHCQPFLSIRRHCKNAAALAPRCSSCIISNKLSSKSSINC